MARLSVGKRWGIIYALTYGKPNKAAVARRYGVDAHAVAALWKKYKETGDVRDKPHTGRPRATTKKQDWRIVAAVAGRKHAAPPLSTRKAVKKLKLSVSGTTVARRLHEAGARPTRVRARHALSDKQRSARLRWAKRNLTRNWARVVFTDEKTVYLQRATQHVWALPGETPWSEVPAGSVKVNVHGAMSSSGFLSLFVFNENLTGSLYKTILRKSVIPAVQRVVGEDWILQDDNDPKHRAAEVEACKEKLSITTLPWPSNSPDLNPMENAWSRFADLVQDMRPQNKKQLRRCAQKAWKQLSVVYARSLVCSMPTRLRRVIKAKGGRIRY